MLKNKKGIVTGVANKNSIAWSIVKEVNRQGGECLLTTLNEKLHVKTKALLEKEGISFPIVQADLSREEEYEGLKEWAKKEGGIDFLVHSIAFASPECLAGDFLDVTKEQFQNSLGISCYSFIELVRSLRDSLNEGASIICLTYIGSTRVMGTYNMMGVAKSALESSVRYVARDLGKHNIRVNALSPGPVQTLSARGIKGFAESYGQAREKAFLPDLPGAEEVGKAAVFLLSEYSEGITGTTLFVDGGLHVTS